VPASAVEQLEMEISVVATPWPTTRTPGRAATWASQSSAEPRPFAEIEIIYDLEAAQPIFAEMEADACARPYQRYAFVAAWLGAIGKAQAIEPLIVALRDDRGRASGILPLALSSRRGLRTAAFVGGKHANFHMGVFRRGLAIDREAVAELLARIARLVGLDALLLVNQPEAWQGEPNPLAALGQQESPSRGHATRLGRPFEQWFAAHYSADARKKLRKKTRRLAENGPVSTIVARDEAAVGRALAAFFAQKQAQAEAAGRVDDFDAADVQRFLEMLATGLPRVDPVLELHALLCGERIVAVFGGLAAGDRFCGMITSHDVDPAIARFSPGELLILEVVRNFTERGFSTFDLGVGEARYKDAICEIEERLSDSAIGFTARGRLVARLFLLRQTIKRWIKRRPWALRAATVLLRHAP
jgi:CelD/BcsL family acetyltransferase involved in cellulose biosynthesis